MSIYTSQPIDIGSKSKGRYHSFQSPFSERRLLLAVGDVSIILLAIGMATLLWEPITNQPFPIVYWQSYWYWIPVILFGWWVPASFNDLYDVPTSYQKTLSAVRVITTSFMAFSVYAAIYFLFANPLPGRFFMLVLFAATIGIIFWRCLYSFLSSATSFRHRILIVGLGKRSRSIAKVIKQAADLNYRILGYASDKPISRTKRFSSLPILGQATKLSERHLQLLQVDEVVVAVEEHVDKGLFQWLIECQANGIRITWMPDLYEKLCRSIPIQHVDPDWALHAMQDQPVFSRLQLAGKRLMDLGLVLLSLPFLLMLMPCVALAIRLDSAGPIFYRQIRCGRAGKPFSIFKFRTMRTDAEKDGKARWATKADPRITRIGRFLRKTRLDEIPQILNIARGEMSFVGPRPERPEFVAQLEQEIPFYRTRLMVKPGLTGWAQIHCDYGNSVEDGLTKLQYDFYYLRYWSLLLDLYTIFKTVGVVFKLKGM